jgi:surface antigen
MDRVTGLFGLAPPGVLDRREAGNGYVRVMIVGDAGNWDERGQDIEKK